MTSSLPIQTSSLPRLPRLWRKLFGTTKPKEPEEPRSALGTCYEDNGLQKPKPKKWSLGILADRETDEVPGKSRRECDSNLPAFANHFFLSIQAQSFFCQKQ